MQLGTQQRWRSLGLSADFSYIITSKNQILTVVPTAKLHIRVLPVLKLLQVGRRFLQGKDWVALAGQWWTIRDRSTQVHRRVHSSTWWILIAGGVVSGYGELFVQLKSWEMWYFHRDSARHKERELLRYDPKGKSSVYLQDSATARGWQAMRWSFQVPGT